MVTGDQIVHRRGRLSIAVRASMSIPGLIPPLQHGEQMLVDGGLLNNLPADVMCADPDGDVSASIYAGSSCRRKDLVRCHMPVRCPGGSGGW